MVDWFFYKDAKASKWGNDSLLTYNAHIIGHPHAKQWTMTSTSFHIEKLSLNG